MNQLTGGQTKVTLSSATLREASDLLWNLWQTGRRIPKLPKHLSPNTRADGYEIQSLLHGRDRAPTRGWKIAGTSEAGQRHIGIDAPIAGRLLDSRVSTSGARISLADNLMRVAEVEFVFQFSRNIAPRPKPYTVDEILEAVEALYPAIELPDSRFDDYATVGAAQLIADNACGHDWICGDPAPQSWRELNLVDHEVVGRIVGGKLHRGTGANVLGDPRLALTWLVNELSVFGTTILEGHYVTTGTSITPLAVAPGDEVVADLGSLGGLSVQLN